MIWLMLMKQASLTIASSRISISSIIDTKLSSTFLIPFHGMSLIECCVVHSFSYKNYLKNKKMSVSSEKLDLDLTKLNDFLKVTQVIKHNNEMYTVQVDKLLVNSEYYRSIFYKNKTTPITLRDLHSRDAFDIFVKLLDGQQITISKKSSNEVLSLLKEWKCSRLLNLVDDYLHNNGFYPKRIRIKTLDGQVVLIHMKTEDTIRSLKKRIEDITGIAPEKQILIFRGQNVTDDLTASSISNNDIIYMSRSPVKTINIYVKDVSGKCYTLNVYAHSKIADLKVILSKKIEIPADQIRMMFNGISLDSDKTMTDYSIKKDSTLHCILRQYADS